MHMSMLTPKRKAFVAHFTDPEGDTYLNATRSAMKASPNVSRETASTLGSRWLHNDAIAEAIERVLEEHGASMDVRVGKLASIAKGEYTHTTTYRNYNIVKGKRKLKSLRDIEIQASPQDVIRANDVLNRMQGIEERHKLVREVQSEAMRMALRRFAPGTSKRARNSPRECGQGGDDGSAAPGSTLSENAPKIDGGQK